MLRLAAPVLLLVLGGCILPPAGVVTWTALGAATAGAIAASAGAVLSVQTIEENKKRDEGVK